MSKPPVRNIIIPKDFNHFTLDMRWQDVWWSGACDLVFEQAIDAPEIMPAGSCISISAPGRPFKFQTICNREHQS